MSHEPEPTMDDDGYPLFLYEGCPCEGCALLRAQHDSYKIQKIAHLARKLGDLTEDLEFATAHFHGAKRRGLLAHWKSERRYLERGLETALQRWSPATGKVIWQ